VVVSLRKFGAGDSRMVGYSVEKHFVSSLESMNARHCVFISMGAPQAYAKLGTDLKAGYRTRAQVPINGEIVQVDFGRRNFTETADSQAACN
jgi:hypothetical protein